MGLASLLLLVTGVSFPEVFTVPERSGFSVLLRKLDPQSLKGLGRWRGHGTASGEGEEAPAPGREGEARREGSPAVPWAPWAPLEGRALPS